MAVLPIEQLKKKLQVYFRSVDLSSSATIHFWHYYFITPPSKSTIYPSIVHVNRIPSNKEISSHYHSLLPLASYPISSLPVNQTPPSNSSMYPSIASRQTKEKKQQKHHQAITIASLLASYPISSLTVNQTFPYQANL